LNNLRSLKAAWSAPIEGQKFEPSELRRRRNYFYYYTTDPENRQSIKISINVSGSGRHHSTRPRSGTDAGTVGVQSYEIVKRLLKSWAKRPQ